MRTARLSFSLVLLLLVLEGCPAFDSGSTPESSVAALSSALRDGRSEDAYALMSESYRQRVSLEEFRRYFRDYDAEVQQTARALSQRTGRAEQEAVVAYGEGESLRLVRENGDWRIASDVVNFYDQSTPRATLRSFVRAMERRRYDVVLALIPEAGREGETEEHLRETWEGEGREEVERLLSNLRAALDDPIEEVGDRATMSYGDRFTAQFVREDGTWRMERAE
ncbi:MAG: hypothetical protein H6719_11590 [Sandaracinaceae bacterium]|nr:hypothetical protein [Sandaracinaceae bacterium]